MLGIVFGHCFLLYANDSFGVAFFTGQSFLKLHKFLKLKVLALKLEKVVQILFERLIAWCYAEQYPQLLKYSLFCCTCKYITHFILYSGRKIVIFLF